MKKKKLSKYPLRCEYTEKFVYDAHIISINFQQKQYFNRLVLKGNKSTNCLKTN